MNFADEFQNKSAVITGAGGVYGGWMARAFAAEGMRLLLADSDAGTLDALAADLPGDHCTLAGDLTREADVDALLVASAETFGTPDILVNNAGVFPSGWLLDIDLAEWDRIMGVNLRAVFALTRGIALQMIDEGRGGAVLNISSGAARKMRTTVVPYCTSKTALDRLTKGFALELAEHGIRVNALEPGFAPGSTASPLTDTHVEATTTGIPLGRQSGSEDAPQAALFLCSRAASYITGATLSVDGGNSIGSRAVHQDKKRAL